MQASRDPRSATAEVVAGPDEPAGPGGPAGPGTAARIPPPRRAAGPRHRAERRAARVFRQLWPSLLTGTLLGAGAIGLALLPSLVTTAPLLLVALRPTWSVLLLVGGQVPFLPTLLLASFFRALVDVGYFGLARNNVRSLLLRRVGTSRLVAALSRRGTERPLLWFCLINTNIAVDAALGAGSVPMRRFLCFLVPGTLLVTTAYLLAASSLAPWMRDVVTWIDANASLLILGGVALAACHGAHLALRARLRRRRARQGRQQAG